MKNEGDNQKVNTDKDIDLNNNQESDIDDNHDIDLESMTVDDLRVIAKEKGIKGYASMKKDTLIEKIMELG